MATKDFRDSIHTPKNECKGFLDYAKTLIISLKKSNKTLGKWRKEAAKFDKITQSCSAGFREVLAIPKEVLGTSNCVEPLPPYYCKMPESYVEKVEKALDKWQEKWERFVEKVPRY